MSEASALGTGEAAALPATAGEMLRAARERQGLHLAVLAASLKVPPRKLELIEANRYDELPDATFVRAMALSMCRALKIDAEPVLSRLPLPQRRDLEHVSVGLNEPFRDGGGSSDGVEWQRLFNLPMIGAALLIVAALAVYWLPTGTWSPDTWMRRTTADPAPEQGPAVSAPSPQAIDASPATAEVPQAARSAASEPAAGPVDALPTAPAAPASAPTAAGILSLRADAESWIEVRDASGQILLSRKLTPGEALGLNGVLPLRLTVGNAEATQVIFRGQPVALAPTRDNVARLELK